MNCFLCSDFSAATFPKIHDFLGDIRGHHVLIINTAANGEGYTPSAENNIDPFMHAGATTELFDLAGASHDIVAQKINHADIIYVTGGNTFYLLEHMNACLFKQIIIGHLSSQKVYIGSSAGSVVMGPDIGFAATMDDPKKANLSDYTGLAFVNVQILPHVNSDKSFLAGPVDETLRTYIGPHPMIALEDHQTIYIPDMTHPTMRII